MEALFELARGRLPLLVSFPHSGTYVPPEMASRMTEAGLALPDTDWHVPLLYPFLDELGASRLVATHSRYVVDLNRAPDDRALYPGRKNTGVVPRETFAGAPLYKERAPDAAEHTARIARYWRPYHDALGRELERLKSVHGYALLWDAHSIASVIPALFDGRLPDLNIGTNDARAAPASVGEAVLAAAKWSAFSAVRDARFKGGYITRLHGDANGRTIAVQLEMVQAIYMDERPPYALDAAKAARVIPVIRAMVEAYLEAGGAQFSPP